MADDHAAALLLMRYAFSCSDVQMQRHVMTREEHDLLDAAVVAGRPLPWTDLERHFPALFGRLRAENPGVDACDCDAVRRYFLLLHDGYLARGDGLMCRMSPSEKELCRCWIGRVVARHVRHGEILYEVERLGEGTVPGHAPGHAGGAGAAAAALPPAAELVSGRCFPSLAPGTAVAVHRRFVCDAFTDEEAARWLAALHARQNA